MDKIDLKSCTLRELEELMADFGEPGFRAKQIFHWLHQKQVTDFQQMSNLSKPLREKCASKCYINSLKIKKRLVSAIDGTVKYLYELADGNCIETVLMHYHHGDSLCISTQVGCRMGCHFCASTMGGLARNLTTAELLDQIYVTQADTGGRIGSLVLMGIGEPLDNYDNVLRFLRILSSAEGQGMSLRHVSLSTCGLVDQVYALAEEKLPLTLSVSLHAVTDKVRSAIMPVSSRYPLRELLDACKAYFEKTGRRLSFEYTLISGVNDNLRDAEALARLLRGMNCHVNLIPVNAVAGRNQIQSSRQAVAAFQQELENRGLTATVRRELGSDIQAACGQLRREERMAAGR